MLIWCASITFCGLMAIVRAQQEQNLIAKQNATSLTEPVVCDCGYQDEFNNVWSELWNADYKTYKSSLHYDRHYVVMDYTVGSKHKDTLERVFVPDNVKVSQTDGITLSVKKNSDGKFTSAALGTRRSDFLYGTYRARMKMSNIAGSVAAFYFFRNNTCEIDMESLSRLNDPYKTYFAIQPQIYNEDGSASPLTNEKHDLAFNPTEEYHEYRFDWLPGSIKFFIDGAMVREMTTNVPSSPGRVLVNHWTDGNPNFSGGPPAQDSDLRVSNLNMFFNSSETKNSLACIKSKSPCKVQDIMNRNLVPGAEHKSGVERILPSHVEMFATLAFAIVYYYV